MRPRNINIVTGESFGHAVFSRLQPGQWRASACIHNHADCSIERADAARARGRASQSSLASESDGLADFVVRPSPVLTEKRYLQYEERNGAQVREPPQTTPAHRPHQNDQPSASRQCHVPGAQHAAHAWACRLHSCTHSCRTPATGDGALAPQSSLNYPGHDSQPVSSVQLYQSAVSPTGGESRHTLTRRAGGSCQADVKHRR